MRGYERMFASACTATEMIPTIEMIPATEMIPNHHRNDTGGHHRNDPRNIGSGIKGAVSRNSAKLGNYKMPVKLRET